MFSSCKFFSKFLVIKTRDPDWIRMGIQPKMLNPDPDSMDLYIFLVETRVVDTYSFWHVQIEKKLIQILICVLKRSRAVFY
jgi:hypothetical protein